MTVMTMVAVRDRAVDGFMNPFFVPHIGVATRSFSDEVNRTESPMFKHSDDYDLYKIGEFDDSNGKLLPLEMPQMLVTGKQVKKQEQ